AAALIAFGTGVFVVLREELERSFDAGLLANAEHAGGAFAEDIDAEGVLQASERLIEQLASTGGRVIVLDSSGTVLADSAGPGAGELPLVSEDLAQADRHEHAVRELVVSGDVLRLAVEPVIATEGQRVGYVVWADSTRPLRDLLATVSSALLVGGVLVIGLALVGGLVLARRALAPVADVTDTARAISLSGDFAARVEGGQRGDEVGELAVAFNEMLEALEHNHQTLQRFLGDASHQLRTPVTTIRANLDLAQRPGLPKAERAAILADAREEAERMGRLIGDLLALARAESGARLEFVPVELDALLIESVRRQREAAPHVRMSVSSVEPAIVDGDRDRLRDLLGILLDNAARYTPAGGSVVAALDVHDRRAIVRVEDTGIGLDEADRDRLFERLYRGTRAREMRPSGTGLGLAIARWIVESHGGTIELAGRETGGTVATVTLPVRSP
ncbi:MAG: HAMP domain-containing sensor histidine kinase, partial [Candidatus Limnocylindrales bacterium]|nr:HAMP domain-containing sensor histidine kinase [Candidatus Limnocylindrales bacterium]